MEFAFYPNVLSTISSEICPIYTAKQEQKEILYLEDFFLVVRECGNGVQCIYIRIQHVKHSVDVLKRTGSVYFAME